MPKQQSLHFGILLLLIAMGLGVWFTIPKAIYAVIQTQEEASKNETRILPVEQKEKVEADIARLQGVLRSGDKKGAPNFLGQYLSLGADFETLGLYNFAEDAYLRAAKEDPRHFIPHANLGSLYMARKEFQRAKASYEQSLALNPTERSTYIKLAELYWYKMNDIQSARGVYLEGLIKTNNDPSLVRSFASFLEQIKEKNEALFYWEALAKKFPEDESIKKAIEQIKKQ